MAKFVCCICKRGPINLIGKGVALYRYEDKFFCIKDLTTKMGGDAGFANFMQRRQQRERDLQAFLTIPPSGYICDECGL